MVPSRVWPLAFVFACTPTVPRQEPPERVVAHYDPEALDLPLPNDLAIDEASGLIAASDPPGANDVEREFNLYLRTLDGFPTSAAPSCTFSGPLDPATVTGAAVVLDLTDPAQPTELQGVTAEYDRDRTRVLVRAKLERERVYAVGLWGGEGGLLGAQGQPVVGAPLSVFLRAARPIATCEALDDPSCRATTSLLAGPIEEEERARVVVLERARRAAQPGLFFYEEKGRPRSGWVAFWTFRTVRMGLATLDPSPQKPSVPFPNDLLIEDGKVKLPADVKDDLTTQLLKLELNKLDGFSTTASLITENGADTGAADLRLDPATLAESDFLLANLDAPDETVPLALRCRSCTTPGAPAPTEPDQVVLTPRKPLRSHARYAVYWKKGVRTVDGRPVNTPSAMALLRLSRPLVQAGKSALLTVDDFVALGLEPHRLRLQPALLRGERHGFARGDLLMAWTFTTQTTTEPVVLLRNKPAEWGLPTQVQGGPSNLAPMDLTVLAQISALLGVDLHSHLRWAKEGDLTGASALDASATELDVATNQMVPTEGGFTADTLGAGRRLETQRFLLIVPKQPKFSDGRIPVIVFAHGLGRARRDAALLANQAARAGYATLAIDLPLHGLRSFCADASACRPGTSCVDHRCVDTLASPTDGYRVLTVQGPFGPMPDPADTPAVSGGKFISPTLLVANRDHLRQSVIDMAQLVRVLKDTTAGIGAIDVDDPATTVVERLDPTQPRYVGVSLGGIVGAMVVAAVNELGSATLNVPGASFTDIVLFGEEFKELRDPMKQYLERRGMPEGSQAYEGFLDVARWALDPADPQNFGRHFIDEPLADGAGAVPKKRVFVSWVQGDTVVPNFTTELFLQSIEAKSAPALYSHKRYVANVTCPAGSTQTQCGDHTFLLNAFTPSVAVPAQEEAIAWVNP